ncbi:MAG: SDR family oxidoreductase, partial [Rhodothermales bacterium]
GFSIAQRLAEEGCAVVISARGGDALRKAAATMESEGLQVHPVQIDLTDPAAPGHLIDETVERYGRLDILVNNVGGNRRKPFEATNDDDWRAILELNFESHVRCSRAAIPYMKQHLGGAIVFISSIFGREAGGPGLSIYNTTKSALISLAKIMSLELAGDNIRVNSVAPGSIRFPGGSWDRRVLADPEGMAEFVKVNLPLGRFGTAEEVADVVAFLASSRASLITGACLNVDGGQSKSLI